MDVTSLGFLDCNFDVWQDPEMQDPEMQDPEMQDPEMQDPEMALSPVSWEALGSAG